MARHDFETLLDEFQSMISSNLNTKITSIVSDKGDSITPPALDSNAYFLQTLDEAVANFDPFLVYGIEDIQIISDGPLTHEKIFISAVIVLTDNGRSNMNRIMFRYSRALKEVVEENWQIDNTSSKISVNRSTVVPFESMDSSATYKAIGIEVEFNLAS